VAMEGECSEGGEGRTHGRGEGEDIKSLRHDVVWLERNYMGLVGDYRGVLVKNEDLDGRLKDACSLNEENQNVIEQLIFRNNELARENSELKAGKKKLKDGKESILHKFGGSGGQQIDSKGQQYSGSRVMDDSGFSFKCQPGSVQENFGGQVGSTGRFSGMAVDGHKDPNLREVALEKNLELQRRLPKNDPSKALNPYHQVSEQTENSFDGSLDMTDSNREDKRNLLNQLKQSKMQLKNLGSNYSNLKSTYNVKANKILSVMTVYENHKTKFQDNEPLSDREQQNSFVDMSLGEEAQQKVSDAFKRNLQADTQGEAYFDHETKKILENRVSFHLKLKKISSKTIAIKNLILTIVQMSLAL
jgi:hypothetical protein